MLSRSHECYVVESDGIIVKLCSASHDTIQFICTYYYKHAVLVLIYSIFSTSLLSRTKMV